MKKILVLIFSLALCLTIAACGSSNTMTIDLKSGKSSSSAPPTVSSTPTEVPAGSDKTPDKLDDMYNAYSAALKNLLLKNVLPDGTAAAEVSGDMAQNRFTVCDVDNDGKKELLLMYTSTYMAGQAGYVFAYDEETKKLNTELIEFPMLTFYDNGIVKAGWSHNQGRAGEHFWPYSLYQYSPKTDSYQFVGMVDAWDKSFSQKDDQNNPFPSDVDKSGTGYVYYIMKDKQYDNTHPVDAAEYNKWLSTYIGNASEIQIKYMDLTEENISKLSQ